MSGATKNGVAVEVMRADTQGRWRNRCGVREKLGGAETKILEKKGQ